MKALLPAGSPAASPPILLNQIWLPALSSRTDHFFADLFLQFLSEVSCPAARLHADTHPAGPQHISPAFPSTFSLFVLLLVPARALCNALWTPLKLVKTIHGCLVVWLFVNYFFAPVHRGVSNLMPNKGVKRGLGLSLQSDLQLLCSSHAHIVIPSSQQVVCIAQSIGHFAGGVNSVLVVLLHLLYCYSCLSQHTAHLCCVCGIFGAYSAQKVKGAGGWRWREVRTMAQ